MTEAPLIDPLKDPNAELLNPKRRKGAPKGNKNALRHGFYAKNLGLSSPSKLDEFEMRNLMGEAAMLKDYMYILYTCNLEVRDSAILAETLRALSLAGMALSRLLQVHCDVRISRQEPGSNFKDFLNDMGSAATRANRLATSLNIPLDDEN